MVAFLDNHARLDPVKVRMLVSPLHKGIFPGHHRGLGVLAVFDEIGIPDPGIQTLVAAQFQEHQSLTVSGVLAHSVLNQLHRQFNVCSSHGVRIPDDISSSHLAPLSTWIDFSFFRAPCAFVYYTQKLRI